MAGGGSGWAMLTDVQQEDAGLDLDALVRYLSVVPQPVDAPAQPRIHARER
jgi:hypothetical protein